MEKFEPLLIFLHVKNPSPQTIKEKIKQELRESVNDHIKWAKKGVLTIHESSKWTSPKPWVYDYRLRIEPLVEEKKVIGVITTYTFGCDNSQEANIIKFEK